MADLATIHKTIVDNDMKKMKDLIKNGVDFNQKFNKQIDDQHDGMSPLALACALQKKDFVQLMLKSGANVNYRFASLNTTALMTTSFHGHVDILQTLLEAGADVKATDLQQSTALGYAFGGTRNIEAIQMLIDRGVDVNQRNMLGMSSLLLVAGYGDDQLVSTVLRAGADPKATNDYGHTALHLAVVGKRDQLNRLAAQGIPEARTAIDKALNRRNIDLALRQWAHQNRILVGNVEPDPTKFTQVGQFMMKVGQHMDAVLPAQNEQEAMRQRVEAVHRYRDEQMAQAKLSHKPGLVKTILSCGGARSKQPSAPPAARPLTEPSSDAMAQGDAQDSEVADTVHRCASILRMLIDARCDIDRTDRTFGMTPLDMAMLNGDIESTAILVGAGSDVNHLAKMFAVSDLYVPLTSNDKKAVKDLVTFDRDLDVNVPFSRFNFVRATQAGAQMAVENPDEGLMPVAVAVRAPDLDNAKLLVKKGANINGVGVAGRSPLAEACGAHSPWAVSYLLGQGADLEYTNPQFRLATPLVATLLAKAATDERKKEQQKVVEMLIKKGAKVDKETSDGRNALILAFEQQDMVLVDMLLSADTNVNFDNRQGVFCELARQYQQPNRNSEEILRKISEITKDLHDKEEERKEQERLAAAAAAAQRPAQSQARSSRGSASAAPQAAPTSRSAAKPAPPPQQQQHEEESSETESSEESEEESDEENTPPVPAPAAPAARPAAPAPAAPPAAAKQAAAPPPVQKKPQPPVAVSPPPQQQDEEESSEEESSEEEEDEEDEAPPPPPATKAPAAKPAPPATAPKPAPPTAPKPAVAPAAAASNGNEEEGTSSEEESSEEESSSEEEDDDAPPPPPKSQPPPAATKKSKAGSNETNF